MIAATHPVAAASVSVQEIRCPVPSSISGRSLLSSSSRPPSAGRPVSVAARLFILLVLLLSSTLLRSQSPEHHVLVNEVMYTPATGEPEWVELYNPGDAPVNLAGWSVQDRTSARPVISSGMIPAGGYVVLTRDTAALLALRSVPAALIRITLPSLNNSGDDVILRDNNGLTVDSLSFSSSWGGSDNRSLERVAPSRPTNNPESWGSSLDDFGATPGRRNSRAPLELDLAVDTLTFDPELRQVRITIVNNGTNRSNGGTVILSDDINHDSIAQIEEAVAARPIPQIEPDSTYVQILPWNRELTIEGSLALVDLDHPLEERPLDNHAMFVIRTPFADTGLIINEFIYTPAAPEPEWVEIYNRGRLPVDLAGWVLHDGGSARPKIREGILLPGEYVVLTKDSAALREERAIPSPIIELSLPSLNNSGDQIILRNPSGRVIDSLTYSSTWGGKSGRSLERRGTDRNGADSSSWGETKGKRTATPGEQNSLVPPRRNGSMGSGVYLPEESILVGEIINTGVEDLPPSQLILAVDVDHDSLPDLTIRSDIAIPTIPASGSDSVRIDWDRPLLLQGETALLILQYSDDERPDDDTLRLLLRQPTVDTGVVINEIMYDPADPEPEWVEIYNRGSLPVDLGGWHLHDATGSSPPVSPAILLPGDYLVLTPDTNGLRAARGPDVPLLRLAHPLLNNSGDVVALVNSGGLTIDSVHYFSTWGGENGSSLERKGFDHLPTDRTSWITSPDLSGATPGRANAWKPVRRDVAIGDVQFDQTARRLHGAILNHGEDDSLSLHLRLYNDANRNGTPEGMEQFAQQELPTPRQGDSVGFSFEWTQPLPVDGVPAFLTVHFTDSLDDEHPDDNLLSILLLPPPVDTGVVINEIMYLPNGDEPEWVELYNRGTEPVDLTGWRLHDAGAGRPIFGKVLLPPQRYLVVTSDTAQLRLSRPIFSAMTRFPLPSLNNTGDEVVLENSRGIVVDSVRYRSSWGGTDGRSLERRQPERSSDDSATWGSSIDGSGGTAGWQNSIYPPDINLALVDVMVDVIADSLTEVGLKIVNNGLSRSPEGEATLYRDANRNGIAEESEKEISWILPPLNPAHTLQITLPWDPPLSPVGESGIALIGCSGDAWGEDNIHPFTVRAPRADSGVIVNEIMFAPNGTEPEWIELYNRGTRPVDLSGWTLHDASSGVTIKEGILESGSYGVLTSDSGLLKSARTLPSSVPLVQVPLPSLNNSGDMVVLRNSDGRRSDSLAYLASWGGTSGRSLERRHSSLLSSLSSSWRSSRDSTGATPGRPNSVIPPRTDPAIDSFDLRPDGSALTVWVGNHGIEASPTGEILLAHDRNGNGRAESDEVTDRLPVDSFPFESSGTFRLEWNRPLTDSGEHAVVELVVEDSITDNNYLRLEFFAPPLDTGLVISEIMFDPRSTGEEKGSDYVELFNPQERPIPLAGWSLSDRSGNRVLLPEGSPAIPPGTFGLIAADSSLFVAFPELKFLTDSLALVIVRNDLNLNVTSDDVLLKNESGRVIDSIHYSGTWHWRGMIETTGVSLELLMPEEIEEILKWSILQRNDSIYWSSSVDHSGGTPGRWNSRRLPAERPEDMEGELTMSPNRISPDGDGFEDLARISWSLPYESARILLDLYDRQGRLLMRLANNEISGAEGEIFWDGTDASGRELPVGIYVLRLTSSDLGGGRPASATCPVIIARRL